jgi:hypothetical protein
MKVTADFVPIFTLLCAVSTFYKEKIFTIIIKNIP